MSLFPQYRFELYKKVGEDQYALTPILVSGFHSIDFRGGVEETKDLVQVRFANQRLNAGSWTHFLGKKNLLDNIFSIDDEIHLLAYYGNALPTPKEDALLLAGRVSSFDYKTDSAVPVYTLKIINRTEELLNTMVPYSSRAHTGEANTSPTAIRQIVRRLNQFNRNKQVFAELTTEINPVTGSYGTVQAVNSQGGSFPSIEYNETWKPAYASIEKLSSPEHTDDDEAGQYIFYVQYTPTAPEFVNQYGATVNELVWKSKSLLTAGTLVDGSTITGLDINLDVREIQNMLIVNAGTDRNGAGITGVAYNLDSIGKFGMKTGYYTKSRRVYSKIVQAEDELLRTAGSAFDDYGFPDVAGFPIEMSFQARDTESGLYNGTLLVATNKRDWNQFLRDEARWQAVLEANGILDRLGEPRYHLKAQLVIGSNNLVLGDIYEFLVPSYGWLGTSDNPSFRLRITDIQHQLSKDGWTTSFEAKEDERVISEALGNFRSNV